MDRLPSKKPVDVLGASRVAAKQSVITQRPQVAGLRERLVRRPRMFWLTPWAATLTPLAVMISLARQRGARG